MRSIIKYAFVALLLASNSSYSATIYRLAINGTYYYGPTPDAVCQLGVNASPAIGEFVGFEGDTKCKYQRLLDYGDGYKFYGTYVSYLFVEVIGACGEGYVDDGTGQCIVGSPCTEGEPLADQYLQLPITNAFFKYGDCQVVVTGCEPASSVVENGYDTTFALCHLATTDKPASEVDNPEMLPQPELPDNTCAAGQSAGTFNGSFICIDPQGKIADTNKPKVKTSGDVITKIDNGDGTYIKTTIKTIINNDGDKIIKTINEKFDDTTGEKLSEDTTEVDETPDNEFGDSGCAAIPVCVGDAIQCAIATQLHKQSCATAIPEGGMTADNLGISVEDQTMIIADDYSVGDDIDTSSFLADTCPTPRPVNLGKYGSFTVDYQPFCEIADIIGKLVIFTATIISIRIIGSS